MGAMNKNSAIIFAGGDFSTEDMKICEEIADINNSYIICADKGYEYCKNLSIKPDIVIGDFDSTKEPNGDFIKESYPPQKDDTDTMLCIKKALSLGAKKILILGGLGGRFDHSFANIQGLHFISNHNSQGYLIDSKHIITAIGKNTVFKLKKFSGYLSVFALTDTVEGVSISGCEYNADNLTIKSSFPIGVSNNIIDSYATISLKSGTALVVVAYAPMTNYELRMTN